VGGKREKERSGVGALGGGKNVSKDEEVGIGDCAFFLYCNILPHNPCIKTAVSLEVIHYHLPHFLTLFSGTFSLASSLYSPMLHESYGYT
jgi:hypothetical protein